ncbi:choice-of-anchor tandem repeat GloVer-containing protein [Methylocystis heyeri]|uniref:Uncharacterized protein n=1 Tax=Methylocystis heyeri TaxID=391905 RepID=A0A6B8KEX0_9HYPH|nr:choice-of-anchor tandem repeat GloVer-containing protein [Methylocystis heyeri]QGM44920.1 hypothetical protein H2LOC_004025 [Methylocystis heyeri]
MNIGIHGRHLRMVCSLVMGAPAPVLAQTWPPAPFSEATLHSFAGSDGATPEFVTLLADDKGALYGTTYSGGSGSGAVFKLTPPVFGASQWTETVLYKFSGSDGANPSSGLIRDSHGSLYGVTQGGGAHNLGAAFKLTPPVSPSTQWSYTKIYDFSAPNGDVPYNAPIFDGSGALIGAASNGGAYGGGTIYKLTPPASPGSQWTAAALYNFVGAADGRIPYTTLLVDTDGAIYGTAEYGGANNFGVVFALTPPGANCTPASPNLWCETVLHSFNGGDGALPVSGLILDSASGALYGTTQMGGAYNQGVVYSLTPPTPPSTQWLETVLLSFAGGQDGANPYPPLIQKGGSLYGATFAGGGTGCGGFGCGTLFELAPPNPPTLRWTENILYRFTGGSDSGNPTGGLIFNELHFGSGSSIYGVASGFNTAGNGSVFALQCAKAAREVFGGAQHAACTQ